jgi:triacylglycerol lipase
VTTKAASFVTFEKAFLNGQINPNGCSTSYTFEYGLAGSGTYSKLTGTISTLGPFDVSKEASGLQANKLYTFRLWAENSAGRSDGSWLYFTTAPAPAYDPILFVHGWNGAVGGWNEMIGWFKQDGWPTSYLNDWTYGSSQSNTTTAQQIASKVNLILSQTGKAKVDLITHSMGSLSARYYLKNLGGTTKVDDFVSLAGPNHGTSDAALSGPFGCSSTPVPCNEMKYNSSFLTALNSVDETPGAVNYGTWRSSDQCDGVVYPSSSVVLNGADNRGPFCVFHTEVRKDYPIYFEVREFVR